MDEKNLVEKTGTPCAGGVAGAAKPGAASSAALASKPRPASPFVRAENEMTTATTPTPTVLRAKSPSSSATPGRKAPVARPAR